MKIVVLSDHTADCLNKKETEREKEYQAQLEHYGRECEKAEKAYDDALKKYKDALHIRKQGIDLLKAKRNESWRDRKIWQAIKYIFKVFSASITDKPLPPGTPRLPQEPQKREADHEEYIWESGREGEKRVSEYLEGQLDDSWYLISGYKNWKGEIDKILVGMSGIFAIEIKNINGRIYCDGDRWWKDKWDNYGNPVEWDVPIKDKKGRSPSRQLNEPADMLQIFLRKTWPDCQIYRMVVFTHESSGIEELNNPTVNEILLLNEWDIFETFGQSIFNLSDDDITKVVKKIEADHHYREKKDTLNNSRKKHQKAYELKPDEY